MKNNQKTIAGIALVFFTGLVIIFALNSGNPRPRLEGTFPKTDATTNSTTKSIEFSFNYPVKEFNQKIFISPETTVKAEISGKKIIITPVSYFDNNSTYNVVITDIILTNGEIIETATNSFKVKETDPKQLIIDKLPIYTPTYAVIAPDQRNGKFVLKVYEPSGMEPALAKAKELGISPSDQTIDKYY